MRATERMRSMAKTGDVRRRRRGVEMWRGGRYKRRRAVARRKLGELWKLGDERMKRGE